MTPGRDKLIAGKTAERADGGDPSPPAGRGPSERLPPFPSTGTWEEGFKLLHARVSRIIEDIQARSHPHVEPEPPLDPPVDRLAVASARLEDGRAAHRTELSMLMEKLQARPAAQLSRGELNARLPQIIAELQEDLRRIEQRMEILKLRNTSTVDAMSSTVEEVKDLRRRIERHRQDLAQCHQTEAELAANQRQMAESLNILHDLVTRSTEIAKSNAAWVEVLAAGPENRHQALRDELTRLGGRVESRSTMTLILAGAAALAALAALVLALTR